MAAPVIHPSAFVSPKAELGEDVVIGPCALIEEDVVIGARTRVDAFASIKRYTSVGEDNHIHSYAMVGGEPQDLKFHGEVSQLIIGNRNNIREFSTLHRGTESGGGVTRIGDGNLLMEGNNLAVLLLGSVVAFFVAILAIKFFINFVAKYGFQAFGWYRIVVGAAILLLGLAGYELKMVD